MARRTARLFLVTALTLTALFHGGCSQLFFYPDQVTYLTPDRLNLSYDDVTVSTADGERLHGWWLPAVGTSRGTVYFLHGNAQNISSHLLNVAWLPEAGYNLFLIDYRGYGQSTGAADLEGILRDAESGLRWLVADARARHKPVYLLGQSLGGAVAVALAGTWQQRGEQPAIDALVVDGTFAGFRAIAREKLAAFWLTWPLQAPLSWTIPDDYEGVDYIARVAPTPTLIIHSARDGIIPFHHGAQLYRAAASPKYFLRTDTPHGATFVIPAYREMVAEFLQTGELP
ncbi:alpha/beta hydrolase [Marinobacter sp. X15-166B]|uniref:alpha/beta hydrolase n=1 Tax=Marinobacter sp. X15-166B TaxID=1897620 RepID=UPI00085C2433|nr:alpha/beta hydrolase [Marinobacter sp. X15-166B]OEY65606.1 alpha/beta hydrolase [Marinobacter sp. X15-166B]